MTWLIQPSLINEPFSDPGVFLDFRFGRRALLFGLGDLIHYRRADSRVSTTPSYRVLIWIIAGFDRLLRVWSHRTTPAHLIRPAGCAVCVEHKLRAYTAFGSNRQSSMYARELRSLSACDLLPSLPRPVAQSAAGPVASIHLPGCRSH
jgi:hypothetical protein